METKNWADIFRTIRQDHRRLQESLRRLQKEMPTGKDFEFQLSELRSWLHRQSFLEENTIFAALGPLPITQALILRLEREHDLANALADETEGVFRKTSHSVLVQSRLRALADVVEMHLKVEDRLAFPLLKKFFSHQERAEMDLVYRELNADFRARNSSGERINGNYSFFLSHQASDQGR